MLSIKPLHNLFPVDINRQYVTNYLGCCFVCLQCWMVFYSGPSFCLVADIHNINNNSVQVLERTASPDGWLWCPAPQWAVRGPDWPHPSEAIPAGRCPHFLHPWNDQARDQRGARVPAKRLPNIRLRIQLVSLHEAGEVPGRPGTVGPGRGPAHWVSQWVRQRVEAQPCRRCFLRPQDWHHRDRCTQETAPVRHHPVGLPVAYQVFL